MRPFELLGLTESATPGEVRARWLQLRGEAHPDKGGTTEGFNQLRRTYEMAYAEATQPRLCPHCAGKGRVEVHRNLYTTTLSCTRCGGTGVAA